MALDLAAPAPGMAVEPPARGVESGADGDEDIVMRLEFRGAAPDSYGFSRKAQLDAQMRHPARTLRPVAALDNDPAGGEPVEDTLQIFGTLANLLFDGGR